MNLTIVTTKDTQSAYLFCLYSPAALFSHTLRLRRPIQVIDPQSGTWSTIHKQGGSKRGTTIHQLFAHYHE